MAPIAVTILDPSNNRSAHLVETLRPIRDLIPPIVAQLKLPERVTYHLIPLGNEVPLPVDKTLASLGVPAGAELQLRPVRNQALKAILDRLYEEAEGFVEDQAWEPAKEKLHTLLQLDPTYPDPLGLEKAVAERIPPIRTSRRAGRLNSRQSAPAPSAPAAPRKGKDMYQLAPENTARRPRSGGRTIALIVIVVVALAAAATAFFTPDLWRLLLEWMGMPPAGALLLSAGSFGQRAAIKHA